jgi:hypothetical protein
VLVLVYWFWPEPEIHHDPGMLAPDEPVQTAMKESKHWQKNGYEITGLAQFKMKGFVLHAEHYSRGRESDLSPVDLAFGWGPMSDQKNVDALTITQGGRWYHWKGKSLPLPSGVIITHSANMHMIPANEEIADVLLSAIKGNIVELEGYLVHVKGSGGWQWVSSLRRDDSGGGACEIVWVEKVNVRE